MTQPNSAETNPQGAPADAAPQSKESATPADASAAKIAALEAQVAELNSRLLRTAADYQNYVRRANQNALDAREQQLMEVARALLTVVDHFDTTLAADLSKASAQSLIDGVRIVRDELSKTLESFGVRKIAVAAGDEFNPKLHEALLRQPVENIPSDHVTSLLQTGYTLNDRTLRPAKVSVAP